MAVLRKTFVYIDSFNLYYGATKGIRNSKWLNVDAWIKTILSPSMYDIQKIKFFTANVSAQPHDLQKPVRQQAYFRALETIPHLELVKGRFKMKNVNIQVTKDVKVIGRVPEEKGTDVNLAVHLVNDAHRNRFDTAVVVSNDSDLEEALQVAGRELGKEIWLINPCIDIRVPTSVSLSQYATQVRRVRAGVIQSSQFNPTLTDTVGSFSKPQRW